jgi:prevent-host-death family protein
MSAMREVELPQAKTRLPELINRAEAGEEIAITRRGKVVARLVPPAPEGPEQWARDPIANLRAARKGVSLGPLSSRDLMREGRQ